MHETLNEYQRICGQMGVKAEIIHTEMDCIEKGIVELISQHGIRKLVMEAAEDRHYKRKLKELRSDKAKYVRQEAAVSCRIQFICKGLLIYTREATENGQSKDLRSQSDIPGHINRGDTETGQPDLLRSQSERPGHNRDKTETEQPDLLRSRSTIPVYNRNNSGSSTDVSVLEGTEELLSPKSCKLGADGSSDESEAFARTSPDQGLGYLGSSSSRGRATEVTLISWLEEGQSGLELKALPQGSGYSRCSSNVDSPSLSLKPSPIFASSESTISTCSSNGALSVVQDGNLDNTLYDQLQKATAEAVKATRKADKERVRRWKAEKDLIETIYKAKEELKKRSDIEEVLEKEKEELEKVKNQRDQVMEELRIAEEQKMVLESQNVASNQMVKDLKLRNKYVVERLQNYEKERNELHMERDKAVKEAEELRRKQREASSMPQYFFSEFSVSDIEKATQNFDPSLKIGEGGYGSVYRGILHNTQVAIKTLDSYGKQGPSEFQMEVSVLSQLTHPNLVSLIGSCPEVSVLIYEYLPNGSLEDRLCCKDNTPPLSWQTRIRIATELCSVLVFLHSNIKAHTIVHGDLKPANILLDANLVSKLSDFGICRILFRDLSSNNNVTMFHKTVPKGTIPYVDPEFFHTGELTAKSDVYSFGIILLKLLTGRVRIREVVQDALNVGMLESVLDPSAGDWPFELAEELARLALRCCDMKRKRRPNIESEVWRVLEKMRASYVESSLFRQGSKEYSQPSPFTSSNSEEVTQDPHAGADGFTYETDTFSGRLQESGHVTSPTTDLELAQCNPVPSHAVRSAINEWLIKKD